jgi:hypothetical protein
VGGLILWRVRSKYIKCWCFLCLIMKTTIILIELWLQVY